MNVRLFQAEDYPEAVRWWGAHGWPGIPLAMLPPLGVVAYDGDGPRAAVWAYMDNGGTGVAMLEWLVTRPENTARESLAAIKAAVGFALGELERLDYSVVLTTCAQQSLAKVLERTGFERTDEQMIHLIHTRK